MAFHVVRRDFPRPLSTLARRLPRRVVDDPRAIHLVHGEIARLGRRGLPVTAGPAHPGHCAEIGDVLSVIHIVEGRLVVVGHVHPDQIQRGSAHVIPPGLMVFSCFSTSSSRVPSSPARTAYPSRGTSSPR